MAWYPHAVNKNIPPGSNDPPITPIGAILHVDAGNANSLKGWFSGPSGGVESHFYVKKNGTCLTPENRVLTSDLRWEPIGSIQVGDHLIGFDENGPRRNYRTATVEAVSFAKEQVYGVVLNTEQVIYTTAEHRWLAQANERWYWRRTVPESGRFSSGNSLVGAHVPRLFEPWDTATDYESGWMAGILDGEGTLSNRHRLSFSQRPTSVLERAQEYLKLNGINHSVNPVKQGSDCLNIGINGPLKDRLSVLGRLRPSRLLEKVNPDKFGGLAAHRGFSKDEKPAEMHKVVAVYPAGVRDIVKVQTSTRTFIAEGYPMHNCEQYRTTTREADANLKGNSFWRNGKRVGFISIETQGYESGEWTDAQLASIKKLLVWCSETHGFPLKDNASWDGPGIAYHVKYGAPGAYTNARGKTCPGPHRIRQYKDILIPWMNGGSGGGGEPYRPLLRRGDSGSAVSQLQGMLGITADGDFGPLTEKAVLTFQASHSLTADGIVGPATWAELDSQGDSGTRYNIGSGVRAYLAGSQSARVGAAVGDEHRWDSGDSWTATERGMVIWRAKRGKAFGVARGIYEAWSETGRENGGWGLPTSDEHARDGVAWQWFDHRLAIWSGNTGTHTIGLGLADAWMHLGGAALGGLRYSEEWNSERGWWYAGVESGNRIIRHYRDGSQQELVSIRRR